MHELLRELNEPKYSLRRLRNGLNESPNAFGRWKRNWRRCVALHQESNDKNDRRLHHGSPPQPWLRNVEGALPAKHRLRRVVETNRIDLESTDPGGMNSHLGFSLELGGGDPGESILLYGNNTFVGNYQSCKKATNGGNA
jgi:hypothetical protein